jgi:hypothetical protein
MVNPESNIEALRKQAAGFRRLAREIVDGDFRRRLLDLESAEFSATFWRPVTCAHSRRATVR